MNICATSTDSWERVGTENNISDGASTFIRSDDPSARWESSASAYHYEYAHAEIRVGFATRHVTGICLRWASVSETAAIGVLVSYNCQCFTFGAGTIHHLAISHYISADNALNHHHYRARNYRL